jgi:predicted alpha/beta-fold hydrolase
MRVNNVGETWARERKREKVGVQSDAAVSPVQNTESLIPSEETRTHLQLHVPISYLGSILKATTMLARRAFPRLQQSLRQPARLYSTTELSNGIHMAYDLYEPEQPAQGAPIILVHGLFGSKRNHRYGPVPRTALT